MHIIQVPSKADIRQWVKDALKRELHWFTKAVIRELDSQSLPIGDKVLSETDSVDKLQLTTRVKNVLDNACIYTVGDLIKKTPWEMMGYRHFGKSCLLELEWKLARAGYALK